MARCCCPQGWSGLAATHCPFTGLQPGPSSSLFFKPAGRVAGGSTHRISFFAKLTPCHHPGPSPMSSPLKDCPWGHHPGAPQHITLVPSPPLGKLQIGNDPGYCLSPQIWSPCFLRPSPPPSHGAQHSLIHGGLKHPLHSHHSATAGDLKSLSDNAKVS